MTQNIARNPQAFAIFRDRFNNQPNVMTPHIIGYMMIAAGRLAVEVSRGEGIGGGYIYGVTVLNAKNPGDDETRFKLSDSFGNIADANDYIRGLRKWRGQNEREHV